MRKTLLASALAVATAATPALARDGSPYIGIEGGVLFPRDLTADATIDFTTTQTPATPAGPAGTADASFNDAFELDLRRGRDLGVIGGYDFGAFRLEAEAAFKRTRIREFDVDGGLVTALNTALNRPSVVPDPGAPGVAALVGTDFDLNSRARVRTLMVNGLLDFGNEDGLSFYAGAGIGRARFSFAGLREATWAGQLIAGARVAITPNVDVGIKYRHLRTPRADLGNDAGLTLPGNPNLVTVNGVPIAQTTNATLFTDFEPRFRSHSLLASLIFNFAAPEAAPPPPPPPPVEAAPPPPPPQTQTCPDGSVILATDVCPAPPPPPPPPAPAPERG
uniref:outer membrane protein n=1 Tax=uncultured Sphingomonas sp. TaxID=158754 RepID=UPI0025DD6506|nr:outer membrane beta-barrel protein [uncultured Sphingomonas sp.]